MELEIIDTKHAMPLPDPAVAEAEPAVPSDQEAVAETMIPPANPQPVQSPAPQPIAPPVPQAVTRRPVPAKEVKPEPAPARVRPLGPGPVAAPQAPIVPQLPKPASSMASSASTSAPASAPSKPASPQASPKAAASLTPPRPRLDAGAIARTLAAKAVSGTQTRLNSATIGSAIGRAAPRGAASLTVRQRVNLEEMIRAQVTPCWNPPASEERAASVTVLLRIRLDRSGAVIGAPEVVATKGVNANNAAYARSLAGSVRRAVARCSPLRLPPELFDAWSDVELNFDPKDVT